MADNTLATQEQVPQLQKVKQAFAANSSLANPVRPTAFNTDSDNG